MASPSVSVSLSNNHKDSPGSGETSHHRAHNHKGIEKRMKNDIAAEATAGTLNVLPLELQVQVLSFLPVRTLLLLRSVCKWFLSMIDHPDFVSFHLLHYESYKLLALNNIDRKWSSLQSSVDGVCLIISNRNPGEDKAAMLYNPSVERKRILEGRYYLFALGYHHVDSSSELMHRCYRVLAVKLDQAWIYSMDEDTWTDVTLCSGFRPKDLTQVHFSETLCFSGPVVWTESTISRKSFQLVWFDFGSKRFRYSDQELAFPVRSGIFKMHNKAVGVWKIDSKKKQLMATVWASQTDTMAWVPLYTIPQEVVPEPTPFRWFKGVYRQILRVCEQNGKWVCVYWKHKVSGETKTIQVVSYDLKTHAIEHYTKMSKSYTRELAWLGYYRESLVMIQSLFGWSYAER